MNPVTAQDAYRFIYWYRDRLTRQQFNTLKGQVRAGDVDGAMRGLNKLLRSGC